MGRSPVGTLRIPHTQLKAVGGELEVFFELWHGNLCDQILLVQGVGIVVNAGGILHKSRHLPGEIALLDEHAQGLADDNG